MTSTTTVDCNVLWQSLQTKGGTMPVMIESVVDNALTHFHHTKQPNDRTVDTPPRRPRRKTLPTVLNEKKKNKGTTSVCPSRLLNRSRWECSSPPSSSTKKRVLKGDSIPVLKHRLRGYGTIDDSPSLVGFSLQDSQQHMDETRPELKSNTSFPPPEWSLSFLVQPCCNR